MAESDYVERAITRVREVMVTELAVVHSELEARIAEAGYTDSGVNIDPHHITTALRELVRSGELVYRRAPSRGGRDIDTIELADRRRRATALDKAAARKRLLYARYSGWANATARHPRGLLGPAGEAATRSAIIASGAMQPAQPGAGEVKAILGTTLRGPADSGGYMIPFSTQGLPGPPVTILVEVKNIRSWVYPQSQELYQLLDKAASLQETHRDQPIVPVLVCRRAHRTLFKMARQIGFFAIATERQLVGEVTDDELLPVRNELHFNDLHRGNDLSQRVRDRFRDVLPEHCANFAGTWVHTCRSPRMATCLHDLSNTQSPGQRARTMEFLRHAAEDHGLAGGW
ncbi:MAG: hypothetical protein GEU83_14505 [Pseudonocardiaceae bacterium]|nr:hypothetical protein [Pseudonocardiaceae bacterium]